MRLIFLLLLLVTIPALPLRSDPLAVGAPAPRVAAPDQSGKLVHFADVYAKGTTLVYFYPKAGTFGCTAEACSLRDSYAQLRQEGLQIIGVSRDSSDAQSTFQKANHLPFTLIADPQGTVAAAFGVPKLLGILPVDARESFLVKSGKIVWNSPHAQTAKSADEIQKALASIK